MKYANFGNMERKNINIGDYLQFMITDYLYDLIGVSKDEIVRLDFKDISVYDGDEVVLPFCYSIIDFIKNGRICISKKIKPVFIAITLSSIDFYGDIDEILKDDDNRSYLLKYSPIGCRDERTYDILMRHNIPAYINGCMTVIFPRYSGTTGEKILFVDVPKALLPYIPKDLEENCEFSTQQYNFNESDIEDCDKIFEFVKLKYEEYKQNTKLAITSRLHVALPLTAFGIPTVLVKDNVDFRFSFIEAYFPIYDKKNYKIINWSPRVPDLENIKETLIKHAILRINGSEDTLVLEKMEDFLTSFFKSRKVEVEYKNSHIITHKNSDRFDEYSDRYWNYNDSFQYALWGASKNNAEFWKDYIETKYPKAELTAVIDTFNEGNLLGLPYQKPDIINDNLNIHVIVCGVSAAAYALEMFKRLDIKESRYCITSDTFLISDDIIGLK